MVVRVRLKRNVEISLRKKSLIVGLIVISGTVAMSSIALSLLSFDGLSLVLEGKPNILVKERIHVLPWEGSFDTSNLTHPHLGARHPNGSLGWIVNPSVKRLTPLRSRPILPEAACPTTSSIGIESEGGNQVLKKVKGGLDRARQQLSSGPNSRHIATATTSRILCMVYTVYTNQSRHENLKAIVDTWGRGCDGFLAASNYTDHALGAIDLPHIGPEMYGNMWQKIRSMWAYAYDHFLDDYDYFYICGDDTYLAIENLIVYLEGPEVERLENGYLDKISNHSQFRERASQTATLRPRPLLISEVLWWKSNPVMRGGGGYVLNRAALSLYGQDEESFDARNYTDAREDIFLSWFFADKGIWVTNTRDEDDRIRWGPGAVYSSTFTLGHADLIKEFGFQRRTKIDSVSEGQITFHLKDDKRKSSHKISDLMYRYHALLYDLCNPPNMTESA